MRVVIAICLILAGLLGVAMVWSRVVTMLNTASDFSVRLGIVVIIFAVLVFGKLGLMAYQYLTKE